MVRMKGRGSPVEIEGMIAVAGQNGCELVNAMSDEPMRNCSMVPVSCPPAGLILYSNGQTVHVKVIRRLVDDETSPRDACNSKQDPS